MTIISQLKPTIASAKPAATTVPMAKPQASRMQVLFSQPPSQIQTIVTPLQAGQAGQAGNPYKLGTELGYAVNRTWFRYGQADANGNAQLPTDVGVYSNGS